MAASNGITGMLLPDHAVLRALHACSNQGASKMPTKLAPPTVKPCGFRSTFAAIHLAAGRQASSVASTANTAIVVDAPALVASNKKVAQARPPAMVLNNP